MNYLIGFLVSLILAFPFLRKQFRRANMKHMALLFSIGRSDGYFKRPHRAGADMSPRELLHYSRGYQQGVFNRQFDDDLRKHSQDIL